MLCCNPYHKTLDDVEVIVDNLGQGSQAVGCARSIAVGKSKNIMRYTEQHEVHRLSQNMRYTGFHRTT